MQRCYPLEPGFGSGRTAERHVWEVLRDQLSADAALLHSVTMIERATEYEADLVIGGPGVGADRAHHAGRPERMRCAPGNWSRMRAAFYQRRRFASSRCIAELLILAAAT
jgi:hypothetical protein